MNAATRKRMPIIISDAAKKAPAAIKSETVRKLLKKARPTRAII